ncbi:MAG: WecB/TagA/CpsF family glycosyltransferase [Verrucomicrobiales bacterium]|jgi:exopolysaccharide biosynthesis WecB/TagA/CpsF family protein|nr:WecB/TagA/CpsF family glycosyltransferase [Verrucomicrobiales bacterium]
MKVDIFGIHYSVTDYARASDEILSHAQRHNSFAVSALAVHGLIESYRNPELRGKVEKIDLIVPDGQPIRWAMNYFHNLHLTDRVYGPTLTLHVLEKANQIGLKVFLYGSKSTTLEGLSTFILNKFPRLEIVGIHPDRFRDATRDEDAEDIKKINASHAHLVLVGRGCPRQEVWVSDHLGKINSAMLAVGAAFDFHAGVAPQAPEWMQRHGLEWLFRLFCEPQRLWKRYLVTNSFFIFLFFKKMLGIKV